MKNINKYIFFAIVVFANVVLKSLFSDYSPFSYDEIISVKDTLLDFGHLKHEAEWDNNPPFYYYCLWVWHKVLPINEFNARLLSVLFVSFAIGLIFLFSQKHFGLRTATIATLFLSISNFITYYSQETRVYSLILLLAAISSILFFKYLNDGRYSTLIILSIINFIVIYSHYIAGIIILTQYVFVVLYFKEKFRVYVVFQTLIIVALVFLRFTKKQFYNILHFNKKEDFWLQPAGYSDLLNALSNIFYNEITAIAFVIIGVVFVISYSNSKKEDQSKIRLYCFFIGFLSVAFLFILGTFKAIFLSRYLIFCLPFATILVVDKLFEFKVFGQIVIIILLFLQISILEIKKKSGVDYQSVATAVKNNKKENDQVFINTRDNLLLFQYYYNKTNFIKYKNLDSISNAERIYGINMIEELKSIESNGSGNVFLVQSFHKIKTDTNSFKNYLMEKHKNVFSTNFFKGVEFNIFCP